MRMRNVLALGAGAAAVATAAILPARAAAPHHDNVSHGATLNASPVVRTAATGSGCGYTKQVPLDRYKGLPDFTPAKAARPYVARMYTTQGVIAFRALTTKAPCTTYSFRFLATRHYFDGTHCHRLTTQRIYVLQCGDPTGTGSGGPGYAFKDENLAGATYPAGTVAMANAGPDTNGSQFFVVTKDTKLSPAYTPFGVVTGGRSTLRRIAAAGDDQQNGAGDGYPHRFTAFLHVSISRH